jgi:hypothetical protein
MTKHEMELHIHSRWGRLREVWLVNPNDDTVAESVPLDRWESIVRCDSWLEAMAALRAGT